MKTLADIGELAAIERIARFLPARADIIIGVGDDCAVVRTDSRSSADWLLTSDAVVEGIHFIKGTSPSRVGHKAIGRVLSDLAAMGGEPKWALIDIVAPPKTPISSLDGIYAGISGLAGKHGIAVVGGDMTQGPTLEIHAFGVGASPKGEAILRSGARLEDIILVTGSLGGSLKGKHLRFEPRVREGIFLRNWATSMIDVSDGLASDLRHIIEMSDVGARLYLKQIPISSAVRSTRISVVRGRGSSDACLPRRNSLAKAGPNASKKLAGDHALYDGEDFELLFTIPRRKKTSFLRAWRKRFDLLISEIGVVTSDRGKIAIVDEDGNARTISETGFQHFEPR